MKPGDLVCTKAWWGFLQLNDYPDEFYSNTVINLRWDQPVIVIGLYRNQAMVMVPTNDGNVCFGWREQELFRVINEAR